jgi:hypothetical protein
VGGGVLGDFGVDGGLNITGHASIILILLFVIAEENLNDGYWEIYLLLVIQRGRFPIVIG